MSKFNCSLVVQNRTGQDITYLSVTHHCGDFNETVPENTLPNGKDSKSIPIGSTSGEDDHDVYTLHIGFSNGVTMGRTEKQCDLKEKDAGGTVFLCLNAKDFDIICPQSESCMGNAYRS